MEIVEECLPLDLKQHFRKLTVSSKQYKQIDVASINQEQKFIRNNSLREKAFQEMGQKKIQIIDYQFLFKI